MFCKLTENVTKYLGNFSAQIIQQELKKSPNLVSLISIEQKIQLKVRTKMVF